jgi:hypothetical protein
MCAAAVTAGATVALQLAAPHLGARAGAARVAALADVGDMLAALDQSPLRT